ncbi:hypothetical protein JDV02_009468 [Purpureocillium takamizusanense]|uniref:Chromo domain-containing protein n=1 Tax=Purpureocillium takamizusanense TaxID=2060973 RepID=A0A9Q8VFP1_9HYPO|nr:uncharacterized protein JDV02_009468 [Purpureocillium takamizusanense]UNI23661.1 hypothetical protein JDV02_009468 [Purpureocillium takamizusanense]
MKPGKTSAFIGREVRVDRDEAESFEPATTSSPEPSVIVSDMVQDHYSADNKAFDGRSPSTNGQRSPEGEKWSEHESKQSKHAFRVSSRKRRETTVVPRRSTRNRSTSVTSARLPMASTRKQSKSKVPKPKSTAIRKPQRGQSKKAPSSDEWEVDKIVDDRIDADTYVHYYLVQWKGWAPRHNTWEPKRNLLQCWDVIEEYEARGRRGGVGK